MRRWCIILAFCSIICAAFSATPKRHSLINSKRTIDAKLMVQQRYTADVAGATFVALRDVFESALTNTMMAGAVLAAYTNSLDAADSTQVVAAVQQYSDRIAGLLQDFLLIEAEHNAAFRESMLEAVDLEIAAASHDSTLAYVNGEVIPDIEAPTGVCVLSNNTAVAFDVRDASNVVVRVSAVDYLS